MRMSAPIRKVAPGRRMGPAPSLLNGAGVLVVDDVEESEHAASDLLWHVCMFSESLPAGTHGDLSLARSHLCAVSRRSSSCGLPRGQNRDDTVARDR